MFAAFTDEKDEDDIGGYIYDIKYIADSLQSRLLRIFAVFGLVLTGTFTFFYLGGVRVITEDFVSRMPAAVISVEDFRIIDLHPVETLIFIIKVSTMLAVLAVLPMLLYYAWPAMKERGLTVGQRSVVYEWTVAFVLALAGGTLLGYYYIAPGIIGFLVYDASRAGMVISYRISKFSWLIIYTTVGVGLLACVPVTMWMLFRGKLASFRTMRNRWREVTIAVFAVAGVFTPVSVLTMFLVAIPTMLAYGVGLAGLWAVTLGGRRDYAPPEERTASDDGNARWLALIVAVLVLVGIGVAATGGISAVVDDDAFGTDDAPDELAGNASNESANESPADANETGANESEESNESTDAQPANESAEENESDAFEEPADSDATENDSPNESATEDADAADETDAVDDDTDAEDENTTADDANETEGDDEDNESGIDIREPIDD